MDLEYGCFINEGKDFSINTSITPKPWVNYLWNKNFLSSFAQNGQGSALCRGINNTRINLITSRMIWLVDEDKKSLWSASGIPAHEKYDEYECIHGQGYSIVKTHKNGIRTEWRVFIPENDNCEIWTIKVANTTNSKKNQKIIFAFESDIGKRQDHTSTSAWFDSERNALCGSAVLRTGSWYHHLTTGKKEQGFFTMDREFTKYDCRQAALYGPYGSKLSPDNLTINMGCTNSSCESEDIIFAIETVLKLDRGEESEINLIAGVFNNSEDIETLRKKYFQTGAIAEELSSIKRKVDNDNSGISIDTPELYYDSFYNSWLKHQLQFNSIWARVYYNGFRDLCQDTANLALLQQKQAEERLLDVLKHQYKSGFAPRAWIDGDIIDQDYSDSPVWITYAVYNIVMEDGNTDFLSISIPFLDSDDATVYEHLKRSLEYLWKERGPHGLSLIRSGDWNDMLNGAGPGGKGESVWLSMALLRSQKQFIELADIYNREEDALLVTNQHMVLEDAIETYGWDRNWYLRGYTDKGDPIGSEENNEGSIFLNPQSWSVLSGTGISDRQRLAMVSAVKHLDTDIGIKTMTPSYTSFQSNLGYISAVRPGSNVNGGIYVHASVFFIKANCVLKQNSEAWEGLNKILPFSEVRKPIMGSPFSLPNSYWGPAGGYRYREYGGSWTTGSAGWLFSVMVNDIFGLKSTWEGIELDPCLPPHWNKCSISRNFRNASYNIHFTQEEEGPCNRIKEIQINGEPFHGSVLPCEDGKKYDVFVKLVPNDWI